MFIRTGMNVQYTHDEEALIADIMDMPEFAGVSAETLTRWLDPMRDYGCNADYWMFFDDEFDEPRIIGPVSSFYTNPRLRKVERMTLWRLYDTKRQLLETNGFSCLGCHHNTPWDDHPSWDYQLYLRDLMGHRSSYRLPVLICKTCLELVMTVFAYTPVDSYINRAVKKAIAKA